MRTKLIKDKFQKMGEAADPEMDKRIHEAYVQNNERFSATIDERKQTRDQLAKDAKEF